MVLQQLSGVNAVLFYSTPVLSSVLKGARAGVLSVGITVVNALMTLPAIALVDVSGCGGGWRVELLRRGEVAEVTRTGHHRGHAKISPPT